MPAPDPQALAALPLFRGLPREHRAMLTDLLHARSAPAGALLISAEQPGEVAYPGLFMRWHRGSSSGMVELLNDSP
jgi:hypothetical protein